LRALCFANDLKSKIFETSENMLPARGAVAHREPERVRILVVDNYDSFTYNLVQLIETLGADVEVVRNDAVSASALAAQRGYDTVMQMTCQNRNRIALQADVAMPTIHLASATPMLCATHSTV